MKQETEEAKRLVEKFGDVAPDVVDEIIKAMPFKIQIGFNAHETKKMQHPSIAYLQRVKEAINKL